MSSIGDGTEEDAPESSAEESTETTASSYTADDVKAMLNALPSVSELEGMSEAEQSNIYEQAQEAYDVFESLTDEEQIGLEDDLVKLGDVMDYLTTFTMPLGPDPVSKLGLTVTVPNYALYYANAQSWDRIKLTSVDVAKNGKNLTVTWTIRYFESDWDWSNNRNPKTATWTYTINDFSCEKDVNITLKDYKNTTNKYWSTFTITRSAGHDYKEGICICGEYPPAIKNSEDYYEIGNLSQLMWFANQVNSKTITAHKAKLTADITIDNSFVWKPITLADKSSSIFDGNGHTITFANTTTGSSFGLFASYNYSTIKNLYLAGSISCNSSDYTAVLVNKAHSTLIENVISTCTIDNLGKGNTGGLTGYFGGGDAAIKNCAVYANVKGDGNTGGLIGAIWDGNQPVKNVTNCVYMGTVTGGSNAGVGALVGYNGNLRYNKSKFTNVYFYEKNMLDYIGLSNAANTITLNKVEAKSIEQFESGEVTYLLNNGVTDGTQTWYQTIGTGTYPKFTGDTVYGGYICGSGNKIRVYRNSMDGIFLEPHAEHE